MLVGALSGIRHFEVPGFRFSATTQDACVDVADAGVPVAGSARNGVDTPVERARLRVAVTGIPEPAERVVSRTTTPAATVSSSTSEMLRERLVRNAFRVIWIPIEPTPFRLVGPREGR